jgi:putative glutamine amidotransferase
MSRRPIVLLPPDLEVYASQRGPLPRMIVQRPYTDAILEAGGLPLVPPPLPDDEAVQQLVALADALVLPGGGFDIDPALYGEALHPLCGELKPERTNLELSLLRASVARNIPVLGICGGMQLMNVLRGGSLVQDLPSQRPSEVSHYQEGNKALPHHSVTIDIDSQLGGLVGGITLDVNSTHHQAVARLGEGLTISARAADGTVEGLEDRREAFFVGVQWHPESMREHGHRAIYRGLVAAAELRYRRNEDHNRPGG